MLEPDQEFSLPFVAGTLVQSTPIEITVSFSPSALGERSASFRLAYFTQTAESTTFRLTGQGITDGLVAAPNPLDFGDVEINQARSIGLTITNSGQAQAKLALTPLAGQNPEAFTLGAPSSRSLAPGASATVNVTFDPLLAGPASASFSMLGVSATVNLTGSGIATWLRILPLDFGFVPVGKSIVKSAVATNLGSAQTLHLVLPLPNIVEPSGAPAFTLVTPLPIYPVAIPPGQSVSIPVSFTPTTEAFYSATLLLATDDPQAQSPVIDLSGYGGGPQISCQPAVTIGPVAVGFSATWQSVVCTNTGSNIPTHPEIGLQIGQADLGTDNPAFSAGLSSPDGGAPSTPASSFAPARALRSGWPSALPTPEPRAAD